MVRGLARDWKQAVGFVFSQSACSADALLKLVLNCFDELRAVGLNVKVIVSDQGSNFYSMTSSLRITVEKPYFEHSGRKYFYMFDPPHLLKSVRNNLFKYNIVFGDNRTAKWSDIVAFFGQDETQRFRLAPKLTRKHLELPHFSQMSVKLAAQVFSRTVAAGLETHSQLNGASASETAEFLMQFNDIFDAVNSSRLRDPTRLKRAMSATTDHVDFFNSSLQWLQTLHVKDGRGKEITQQIKCVMGWKLTLSAMKQLWTDLSSSCEFDFLYGRRLNQDPLEIFFL